MTAFKPHPYQQRAIDVIKAGGSAGLFMECGLGKTGTTLLGVQHLKQRGLAHNVLVIGPKRVVEEVWEQESDKWDFGLVFSRVLGTAQQRLAALKCPADIYLMNFENTEWLVNLCKPVDRWPFDTVIIDESSKLKSHATKRFKALRRVRPYMHRTILLTGTPSPQSLMDLWSQLYLIDMGHRLGVNITAYRNRYFDHNPWTHSWTPRPGAEEEILSRISDVCISLKAEDYLTLPDLYPTTIEVELPTRARDLYRQMEEEALIELEQGDVIDGTNAAVITGKLLQIANGAVYKDEEHNWEHLHDAKLHALDEIVEETNGRPVLVFYQYQHDLERLLQRFKDAVNIKDKGAIERWNKGEVPMLLAYAGSSGYGLNLQAGGHVAVWFGVTWSLEQYIQANARLHRQGQTKPVFLYHIVAANTVDEAVLDRLEHKRSVQDTLMNYLNLRRRTV